MSVQGIMVQLTGLSGAGKTTLAEGASQLLQAEGIITEIVDGDVYRKTICRDLGFSREDRIENIRRLGACAHNLLAHAQVVIIAAINPYEGARKELEQLYQARTVWVHCPLDILRQRDTKGLYKRALLPDGHPEKLKNLTGVNDLYEPPVDPHLVVQTHHTTPQDAVDQLTQFLRLQLR